MEARDGGLARLEDDVEDVKVDEVEDVGLEETNPGGRGLEDDVDVDSIAVGDEEDPNCTSLPPLINPAGAIERPSADDEGDIGEEEDEVEVGEVTVLVPSGRYGRGASNGV